MQQRKRWRHCAAQVWGALVKRGLQAESADGRFLRRLYALGESDARARVYFLVFSGYRALPGAARERVAAAIRGRALWGRWCGCGHGGGAPVDAVDRACQLHDTELARGG